MAVSQQNTRNNKQRPTNRGRGRGRGRFNQQNNTSAGAAAASTGQHTGTSIICYKCGEPGHIAPACPKNTGTLCPCTAPPTRGHSAIAQEGNSTTMGISGTTRNAIVCMARSVPDANTMSARRMLDYNYNANANMRRPPPLPIPLIETDNLLTNTEHL